MKNDTVSILEELKRLINNDEDFAVFQNWISEGIGEAHKVGYDEGLQRTRIEEYRQEAKKLNDKININVLLSPYFCAKLIAFITKYSTSGDGDEFLKELLPSIGKFVKQYEVVTKDPWEHDDEYDEGENYGCEKYED